MISDLILLWYGGSKRDLPWRGTKNPYFIWLSEIILQQTRVEQGMPYYQSFTNKYPQIEDLANASEEEVLRTWQGLGYYSRARNLHYSAKYITNELKGIFPTNFKDLLKLKGVGNYTAAAISSICFKEKKAVVDGNVSRVISRIYNSDIPINSTEGVKHFQKLADELLIQSEPGEFNQAMMELGATICKPQNPLCNDCPVNLECQAKAKNTQGLLPIKLKKVKVRKRVFNYLVLENKGRYLLIKRGEKDIWEGLFDFKYLEGEKMEEDIYEFLQANKILTNEVFLEDEKVHILTHQRITAKFWRIKSIDESTTFDGRFFSKTEIELLPKPKVIVNYIDKFIKP